MPDTTPQGGPCISGEDGGPCESHRNHPGDPYHGRGPHLCDHHLPPMDIPDDMRSADPRAGADPGRYSKEWWMERARREPDGAMDVGGTDASGAELKGPLDWECCIEVDRLRAEIARLQAEIEARKRMASEQPEWEGLHAEAQVRVVELEDALDAANERARLAEEKLEDRATVWQFVYNMELLLRDLMGTVGAIADDGVLSKRSLQSLRDTLGAWDRLKAHVLTESARLDGLAESAPTREGPEDVWKRECLCLFAIQQTPGQPTVHDPRCTLAPAEDERP